jgi:hypothetical protein
VTHVTAWFEIDGCNQFEVCVLYLATPQGPDGEAPLNLSENPMAVIDSVKEAQTRSLEQMKTVQEQVISFNERIADTVLGSMPDFQSPFGEYLPKPTEVVETYFSFMNQMHEANREFASRLANVWERADEAAPSAKAAPKAPAKK